MSEQLHANICLNLLRVFSIAQTEQLLVILLSPLIRLLLLDLVQVVLDNHGLKDGMGILMLCIE
jgi:hypothetical protein